MKSVFRFALGLAVLCPAAALRADDGDLRVDVVVDQTDAGRNAPRPAAGNPIYYLPCTSGYHQEGAYLEGEAPPPPTWEVQHMLAKALYAQGYRVMSKAHQPSIILVLWWGYMAPIIDHPFGDPTGGATANTISIVGVGGGEGGPGGIAYGTGSSPSRSSGGGSLIFPAGMFETFPNQHEMLMLVGGEKHDVNRLDPQRDDIQEAARTPRYFLTVSALDYQAATQRKGVLLWCARVSTETAGHDLVGVLPTLISAGAPLFGQETARPEFYATPIVPPGHVVVGTPQEKI